VSDTEEGISKRKRNPVKGKGEPVFTPADLWLKHKLWNVSYRYQCAWLWMALVLFQNHSTRSIIMN
jgi:hypothetical protein